MSASAGVAVPIQLDRHANGGLRRHRGRDVPARADVLALASLLLRYPEDWLCEAAPELDLRTRALPASDAATHLCAFVDWFVPQAALDANALRRSYVETFDMRRSTSLHLTYFHHGDTRRRGMALLAVRQQLLAHGWLVRDGELADYLPALLEFAAHTGREGGERPLRLHRGGLQSLASALEELDSPYRHVVSAVLDLLGGPVSEAVRRGDESIEKGA